MEAELAPTAPSDSAPKAAAGDSAPKAAAATPAPSTTYIPKPTAQHAAPSAVTTSAWLKPAAASTAAVAAAAPAQNGATGVGTARSPPHGPWPRGLGPPRPKPPNYHTPPSRPTTIE